MKGQLHILVLGKEGVGKTAIVVRFLTKRYLTEYSHNDEHTYERTVSVDGKFVPVKITDIGGKNIEQKANNKEILSKVDGVVVVYAINDRHSFDIADAIVDWLRKDRKSPIQVPLVLMGNKSDLDHRRQVTRQCSDVEDLDWRNDGYMVAECSASSESQGITTIFNKLILKIIDKKELQAKNYRKFSQHPLGSPKLIRASIRRRFSVFTRERTSSM